MSTAIDSSVQRRNHNGNTLLHSSNNLCEAKHLVCHGMDINKRNFSGQVPLHSLMRSYKPGVMPVILYLLSLQHIHVNAAEPDGTTIAHLCEWGPVMEELVRSNNFDPNKIRLSDGNTPLMFCITYPKHPDIAKNLLEDPRIDLEIRNPKNGKTALEMARESTTEYGKQILALIADKIAEEQQVNPETCLIITYSFDLAKASDTSLQDATMPNSVNTINHPPRLVL